MDSNDRNSASKPKHYAIQVSSCCAGTSVCKSLFHQADIISLTGGWRTGLELLQNTLVVPLAGPAVVAGALADIIAESLIAFRRTSRLGVWLAISVATFYGVAGTILRPDLWSELFGPLMKILPIRVLHFDALAVLEER